MSILSGPEWNKRIQETGGSFLQTFEWGVFQERFGNVTTRVMTENLLGQVITQHLPLRMRYAYIPRGPVGEWRDDTFAKWLGQFRSVVSGKPIFLRIDPPFVEGPKFNVQGARFKVRGLIDIGRAVQPKQNLILDLQKGEEELLAAMHQKTRYNIRLAERHDVRINHESDFEIFFSLLTATAGRQGIRLHPRRYYESLIGTIPVFSQKRDNLQHRVYAASFEGENLATALVVYFGNRATYLHGGSGEERGDVMAPYALHWKIIQDAKALGYTEYDFGGVDDQRWSGITRFKKGFGGEIEAYPNAHDLVLDPLWYRSYQLAKKILG